MRNNRVVACVLSVAFTFGLAAALASAQDMVKVAPKNCTVLLENDRVRVVRVVLKAGEKLAMHSHPAYISYSFAAGKTKFTSADGKTDERETKAGTAIWRDAETHAAENTGTTDGRVLVIELKK